LGKGEQRSGSRLAGLCYSAKYPGEMIAAIVIDETQNEEAAWPATMFRAGISFSKCDLVVIFSLLSPDWGEKGQG
jgi:hypothetical protein